MSSPVAGEATRARLREIVANAPNVSAAQLARELGVTRQRVGQLLRSEGLALTPWTLDQHRAGAVTHPPQARVLTGGVPVPLSGTAAGTIAELLVAADLMTRGFAVFFPMVRTVACDLITLSPDAACERIEVRCGKRSADRQRVVWRRADKSKSDRRAIVMTGEPVRYDPPFVGDAGK